MEVFGGADGNLDGITSVVLGHNCAGPHVLQLVGPAPGRVLHAQHMVTEQECRELRRALSPSAA